MGSKRSYGDACRLAHALDVVGERWALLVVRELMLGPKRFTDLRAGLPNVSSNVLAERLRELEQGGVVRRHKLPPPAGSWVYELTDWGMRLEPVVTQLGAWGASSPQPPGEAPIGADSIVLALRSLFDPKAAGKLRATYELRFEDGSFRVEVAKGKVELSRGTAAKPEVTIEADPGALAGLLTGQLSLDEARRAGARIEGEKSAVVRFLDLFPMPEPCMSEASNPLNGEDVHKAPVAV
ncbi:MAG TPA: winged helix-turn-helix transcriptional regulator [Solirubrobacterales bacterium]|jgi:DNA-binding HxlR family transcriptional regulator